MQRTLRDYTPPLLLLLSNEWTGRQAPAPEHRSQTSKKKKNEKKRSHSGKVGHHLLTQKHIHEHTLAPFAPTWIRAPLNVINWRK